MSSMGLPWQPRLMWSPVDWSAEIPMRPPDYINDSIGGDEIAASGVPADYEVRADDLLAVHLRFYEHEWPAVNVLIRRMQRAPRLGSFFPDQNDEATSRNCYLQSPARGERWQPTREESGAVFSLTIVLRSVSGPWSLDYFEDLLDLES